MVQPVGPLVWNTYLRSQQDARQRQLEGLAKLRGVLSIQGAVREQQAAQERQRHVAKLSGVLAGSGGNGILSTMAQIDPKSVLPYVLAKPSGPYTLSPGQVRFGAGNAPLAGLPNPQLLNLGDRFQAIDKAQVQPGQSFQIGVSPTTVYSQGQQNVRHGTPSGSTLFTQDQANLRHSIPSGGAALRAETTRRGQDLGATRSGPGVHRLPDGSTVSNPQLLSMWRTENSLLDPLDLQILGKTDPGRAAMERDKINKAMPFQQWARQRFGVDVTGGFTPLPATPPPGSPQPTPRPMGNVEQRKQLGGKSYVKINGQWFEED